ncbi:MAG: RNA polymerase sigma factor RpoE [Pseudomonadota bacterium]
MGENNKQSQDASVDLALVNRVVQGDKKAFDLLVLKYQHRLAKVLFSYIKDRDEVYDVVQESFIKAYRSLPDFKGDSAFYSWLYRIAINTAKNYLTARDRRPPRQDIDYSEAHHIDKSGKLEDQTSPDILLTHEQLYERIQVSMGNLPKELKQTINLRENEGLNYEQIAAKMNCPVGTVRSRIFRARQLLMDDIKPLL